MNAKRNIKQTWKVKLQKYSGIYTAGLVLPYGHWKEFDPFLLMTEDIFKKGAFEFHPHRGIEIITYVTEGILQYTDTRIGKGILNNGDVQWLTAGSGIVHNEEALEATTVRYLQLWINLPAKYKMTAPRYQDILSKEACIRKEEGVTYKIFSGNSGDSISSTKNHVPVTMVEISMKKATIAAQDLPSIYNGFIYILSGSGIFGANLTQATKGDVLLLDKITENIDISEIRVEAIEDLKILFFAGLPLNERVVADGPFVMNTEEEIKQAHSDFRSGRF